MNFTCSGGSSSVFEKRVERVLGEHVHFVDDVDLVTRRDRAVAHALDELADVVDPGAARGIHLDHVDVAVGGNREAVLACPARLDRGSALAVGADAVERLGDDARRRGLAHAAHAREDEGMREPAPLEGVGEGAHHRLLADEVGEAAGPVFARQYAIGCGIAVHGTCGHGARWRSLSMGWEVDKRPGAGSLRLLPSGPDRVGESPVRRQPPVRHYIRIGRESRKPRNACLFGAGLTLC